MNRYDNNQTLMPISEMNDSTFTPHDVRNTEEDQNI